MTGMRLRTQLLESWLFLNPQFDCQKHSAAYCSLRVAEELESELLVEESAVLVLLGVVVDGSIVTGCGDVGGLSELEGSEEVGEDEAGELETATVGAEDVLVEEEVGTEEEEEALNVNDLGVLKTADESGIIGRGVGHY